MSLNGLELCRNWNSIQFDYVTSDRDLLKCSSSLHVDSVDTGTSDHLLLWVELGKVRKAKNSKRKRVIYQWRVDSLKDKEL